MINPLSLGWFLCSVDVLVRQSNKSIPDFTIHSMWPVWDFMFVKYRNGTCFKIEKRTIKQKKMCVLFTQFVVFLQTLLMVNGKKFLFFWPNEPLSNWKMNANDDDDESSLKMHMCMCELGIQALHFKLVPKLQFWWSHFNWNSNLFHFKRVSSQTDRFLSLRQAYQKPILRWVCRFIRIASHRFSIFLAPSFCMCILHAFIAINFIVNIVALCMWYVMRNIYEPFFRQSLAWFTMLSLILSAVKWMICKSFNFERPLPTKKIQIKKLAKFNDDS